MGYHLIGLFHSTVTQVMFNMHQPPVRKIFVQEAKKTNSQKRLPTSLLSFLALYQMIFGFKFGSTKLLNVKFRTAVHWLSIAMGCFMMSTLSLTFMSPPEVETGHYFKVCSLIQFVPTFFILMSTKYTLCDVLSDLIMTQDSMIGLIAWTYTLLMFVLKMTGAMMYYVLTMSTDKHAMLLQFFLHLPILALDVIPVVNSVLFYFVYLRMRDLKTKLTLNEITLERLETDYRTIADYLDKFRAGYDAMFIWGFITEFPKLMVVMWSHLRSLKTYNSWLINSSTYVYAMHATMQICIPAVFAEMITAQTDEIKLILHERLSVEEDATAAAARLLRYAEARPLVRKAWRALPLDLRLPAAMLSMCSTHLIVLIQLTHLYD